MSSVPPLADRLLAVLSEARELGFLGPGPLEAHIEQAKAYLSALPEADSVVVDLGTGGGVPGLALALWRPDLRFRLVDAMQKRVSFVGKAVRALGIDAEVTCARAELLGRLPAWRGQADVVVARSLAAPVIAAEYIAPLLKPGGYALIAEPPGGDASRWPSDVLERLGMSVGPVLVGRNATLQRLDQTVSCPEHFPRREGLATKRPLRDV